MSDLDDQGSLPSYVERDRGRSARAKDLPIDEAVDRTELEEADERARAHEREDEPAAHAPFEPSGDDPGGKIR